jgi:hypothetical protein
MFSFGMLIHCPSRLGTTVSVLDDEIPCGDGVFAKRALERAKAVHHFDDVMSHNFNCRRSSVYDTELKLPFTTRHERAGDFAIMMGTAQPHPAQVTRASGDNGPANGG